jgi:hypothetical protein
MCPCICPHENDEIKTKLNTDKLDVLLATGSDLAILHRQQDSRVPTCCHVQDDVAFDVVKA